MSTVLKISPVTRIEGHLDVEVTVESVGGEDQVIDARVGSPMFRGFEIILQGRDPRDAVHYTQRVCGVCPVSHGMAASLALEQAYRVVPPANGRILRNLTLGANYLQSHVLHFYHLAALDFIDTSGHLDMSPWAPRLPASDLLTGDVAKGLIDHYVQALAIRRKAHQMGAIFAGRMPSTASFVCGGATVAPTADQVDQFRGLLDEITAFIDDVYLPDVGALAALFPAYATVGRGSGNLLSFGVFDLDATGDSKLLARGRSANGVDADVLHDRVREYVAHSWYAPGSTNRAPSVGLTEPMPEKEGAYSWLKAPRYEEEVHEVGPLARMWVNGDYREGISVIDRHAARALEARKVAGAMQGWLDEVVPGGPVFQYADTPVEAVGVGMTEAPRGALGHWVEISDQLISRYQLVTPTGWNASPRDDAGRPGAMEQALVGTPVADFTSPVEPLRVIHSFDPCVACSVHLLRPGDAARRHAVHVEAGP